MKFLIALISAANVASAIQLNSPLFNLVKNHIKNKITTKNFAQTVVSKTINGIPESLRRKYIESTYRLRLAQQDATALTCDDLQSTVGWIFDQKDADVRAAFQGQYDE
jgi:hypothetical protein